MQELEITIDNESRVLIHVNGVKGDECLTLTKKLDDEGGCRSMPSLRTTMSSRSRFHTTRTTDYGKNAGKKIIASISCIFQVSRNSQK